MITGAAIWPSAPILLLDRLRPNGCELPAEVADQISSCLQAMAASLATVGNSDRVLIIGPSAPRPVAAGARPEAPPGSTPAIVQVTDPLAVGGPQPATGATDPLAGIDRRFATPTWVVRRLLTTLGCALPVSAIEIGVQPEPQVAGLPPFDPESLHSIDQQVQRASESIDAVPGRCFLLVIGDGAAGHGTAAPLPRDDRSADFDLAVIAALAAGRPSELAAVLQQKGPSGPVGLELGSVGFWPLRTLAGLSTWTDRQIHAQHLYAGAPLGVGYHVTTWGRQ